MQSLACLDDPRHRQPEQKHNELEGPLNVCSQIVQCTRIGRAMLDAQCTVGNFEILAIVYKMILVFRLRKKLKTFPCRLA